MIFEDVEEGCLLGGWAVFLNVDEDFLRTTGRSYVGSRDIDIGFGLKPDSYLFIMIISVNFTN
jgi:hypothetical protein